MPPWRRRSSTILVKRISFGQALEAEICTPVVPLSTIAEHRWSEVNLPSSAYSLKYFRKGQTASGPGTVLSAAIAFLACAKTSSLAAVAEGGLSFQRTMCTISALHQLSRYSLLTEGRPTSHI